MCHFTDSTIVKEAELEKLKKNLMTSLEMLSQLRQSCESLNDKYQQMADRYAPQNICVNILIKNSNTYLLLIFKMIYYLYRNFYKNLQQPVIEIVKK